MNTHTLRSAPSTRRRLGTAFVLLVALAACGRQAPEAQRAEQVAPPPPTVATVAPIAPEPTPPTTEVPTPTTEVTPTTVAPLAPPAAVTTVTTVRVRPTTTTTVTVEPAIAPVVVEPTTTIAPAPPTTTLFVPPVVAISHGGPVRDHVSLVDSLRGRGLTVTPDGTIAQPFLHGDGTSLAISGAEIAPTRLQSFQYESAQAAAADAATFGSDGNPRGTMVEWVAPPHLYLRGRVLVIYVGSDPAVTGLLTQLLGPQFAGR